jgi:hypothetical protein
MRARQRQPVGDANGAIAVMRVDRAGSLGQGKRGRKPRSSPRMSRRW